jgi:hypothetical protein
VKDKKKDKKEENPIEKFKLNSSAPAKQKLFRAESKVVVSKK